MSEWWTYTLSDFLMFSPRVYYRLLELHNRELWPAQLVTLALGAAMFLRLAMLLVPASWASRPGRAASAATAGTHDHRRSPSSSDSPATDRLIFGPLGALFLWIAWSFFWERYATINWAAPYVTPAFGLEGMLLIWLGALRPRLTFASTGSELDIVALALFAFPSRRPIAPDGPSAVLQPHHLPRILEAHPP